MKTPLYEEHIRLGAKMTEFAGWEMPLQYAGIAHEVGVVRSAVGIFDISHMGEFTAAGPNALELVQYVTTNDVSALEIGQAQYSLLCTPEGGVIDDLIVYRLEPELYLLIVNASNIDIDFEWISSHNTMGAELTNKSDDTALIAVQGPKAEELLQSISDIDLSAIGRFHIARGKIAGIDCGIAHTGYTGEDGFELLASNADAAALWNAILDAGKPLGAEPIGLGARDVLRLEPAYPLYGHELTRSTNPVSARLMWVVKPSKGEFVGREAILKAKEMGTKQVLIGIEAIDRCIPRHECEVSVNGNKIGEITSGTFSPTLGKGIAMAYVDREYSAAGTEVNVITGGRTCKCRIVPMPFYK